MDLQVPPEFERAILDRVAAGRYPSTEDALKACYDAISAFEAEAGEAPETQFGPVSDHPHRVGRLDIPPTFELALEQRLASGRYRCADDIFNAFLTALQQQEEIEAGNLEGIRREVQVGIDQIERGQVVDGETAFARLRERFGRGGLP